jgi:hypothetical protein
MKPPKPKKKSETNPDKMALTKKERMKLDKDVTIQKENRIML